MEVRHPRTLRHPVCVYVGTYMVASCGMYVRTNTCDRNLWYICTCEWVWLVTCVYVRIYVSAFCGVCACVRVYRYVLQGFAGCCRVLRWGKGSRYMQRDISCKYVSIRIGFQYIGICCRVLQSVAVWCSVFDESQCGLRPYIYIVAECCNVVQRGAVCSTKINVGWAPIYIESCRELQSVAECCRVLQCGAMVQCVRRIPMWIAPL